ncbi:MAG: YaaA family protein [Desulforhopalus sp.]
MQIITAPSKTQTFNGREFSDFSLPSGLDKTARIIGRLKELSFTELGRLMKTSDKLTRATQQKIDNFSLPFSLKNARQALFTFQGDAYSAIRGDSYSPVELHHAQRHLFILSGLYGALRPLDLMQPYRLEMGCSLSVDGAANLYQLWRGQVTTTLNNAFTGDQDNILINLASAEYTKVIDKKNLNPRLITIIFQQPHKSGYKTIPIHSKRARGAMIHYMINNAIDRAEGLLEFDREGYSFKGKESSEDRWVFLQQQ